MQKVLATTLAIPILVLVYAGTLVRRAGKASAVMALVAVGLTGILVATAVHPAPASGTLPSRALALDPSEFSTIVETGESPSAPIVISFPGAMNTASVEGLVRVDPATAVAYDWDPTTTLLSITPLDAWATGTFHTVTVEAGALDATGRPVDHRIRSAFLTREAVTATISSDAAGDGAAVPGSHFRITFSGPVTLASINLDIVPPVGGHFAMADDSLPASPTYEFIPDEPLAAGTTFSVGLADGARDADGGLIRGASTTVTTVAAPKIVRFRPATASTGADRSQNLSVRFTEAMDHDKTEKAWSAVQDGKPVTGIFSWAEGDTVLVFNPAAALGYSQEVILAVGADATSAAGLPLAAAATATFTTAARPPVQAARTSSGSGGSTGSGGSSNGTVGSSTWSAVEAYYLKLMNCTRQGGLVTSTGGCSSPGGRAGAAPVQDAGITAKVSRPYAKKLAVNNLCTHFSGGTPGFRLAAAGYTNFVWAENLGCRSGDPYAAVLGSHLFFQSERSYNGGHYVNLMNPDYDRVGLGVWVSSGRVRLVVDFYHPK